VSDKLYLSITESTNLSTWVLDHFKTCTARPYRTVSIEQSGASGIGNSTYVECHCGARKDITDYELW